MFALFLFSFLYGTACAERVFTARDYSATYRVLSTKDPGMSITDNLSGELSVGYDPDSLVTFKWDSATGYATMYVNKKPVCKGNKKIYFCDSGEEAFKVRVKEKYGLYRMKIRNDFSNILTLSLIDTDNCIHIEEDGMLGYSPCRDETGEQLWDFRNMSNTPDKSNGSHSSAGPEIGDGIGVDSGPTMEADGNGSNNYEEGCTKNGSTSNCVPCGTRICGGAAAQSRERGPQGCSVTGSSTSASYSPPQPNILPKKSFVFTAPDNGEVYNVRDSCSAQSVLNAGSVPCGTNILSNPVSTPSYPARTTQVYSPPQPQSYMHTNMVQSQGFPLLTQAPQPRYYNQNAVSLQRNVSACGSVSVLAPMVRTTVC